MGKTFKESSRKERKKKKRKEERKRQQNKTEKVTKRISTTIKSQFLEITENKQIYGKIELKKKKKKEYGHRVAHYHSRYCKSIRIL